MANVNRVIIAGNLTRDPQVRFLANDKAVANFTIAINSKWKAGDGTLKEDVTFVDCEAWGRTAELVGQYLTKGAPALIEGKLRLDTWEKDGVKHSKLKVVAESVQFLSSKRADAGEDPNPPPAVEPSQRTRQTAAPVVPPANDDDIPPF